eukprot:CAMPEP_0197078420 /NCGR_PEP_ID=MMETSP1384-20130603/213112_1 /TAXON_ID=29189 /ORGANISM="Ammonia sp." /LENGTH=303 /DNA_ID=CAMNT_0042517287 /DNA_START=24 /DNA_END=936 /DNA_ORIENTATION=+
MNFIFLAALIASIASSCEFFEFYNLHHVPQPPAIPCDVCLTAGGAMPNGTFYTRSYKYSCTSGNVVATSYTDSNCKMYSMISPSVQAYTSTSGGICDHITFKAFVANKNQRGDSCVIANPANYIEMAFVEGCYDLVHNESVNPVKSTDLSCTDTASFDIKAYTELDAEENESVNPVKSTDLSCTDTASFDIKAYTEYGCRGNELNQNRSTIEAGCHEKTFNTTLIHNIFPNFTVLSVNESLYFEIAECGAKNFPLWVIIVIAVAACLCCCGCCAVIACLFVRSRRRKGINNGYVQTYGEGMNA